MSSHEGKDLVVRRMICRLARSLEPDEIGMYMDVQEESDTSMYCSSRQRDQCHATFEEDEPN